MPNSFTVATTVLPPAVKSFDLDKLTICRIPFLNIKAKLFCIGEFYVKSTDWNQYNEPGIYFLLEQVALNDNNYRTPFVYIGQAKEIGERLKNHSNDPDKTKYYSQAIAFTSSDFNDTLLNLVEKICIQKARESHRVLLTNKQKGSKTTANLTTNSSSSLTRPEIQTEFICTAIEQILLTCDQGVLTPRHREPSEIINDKKPDKIILTQGCLRIEALSLKNNGLLILKGSSFSQNISASLINSDADQLRKLLKKNNYIDEQAKTFKYDYFVRNETLAVQICLGKNITRPNWKHTTDEEINYSLKSIKANIEPTQNNQNSRPEIETSDKCSALEASIHNPLLKICFDDIYKYLEQDQDINISIPNKLSVIRGFSYDLRVNDKKLKKENIRLLDGPSNSVLIKIKRTNARLRSSNSMSQKLIREIHGEYIHLNIPDKSYWDLNSVAIMKFLLSSLKKISLI